jgi:hypothetical protein
MVTEVGEGGLRIVTGHTCQFGDEMIVTWLIDGKAFAAQCVVRDIRDQQVGLEFKDSANEQHRRFCEWLHTVANRPSTDRQDCADSSSGNHLRNA